MLSKVYFKRTNPDAVLPVRATNGSAGYDLCAVHSGIIHPGGTMLFKTGLVMVMEGDDTEGTVLVAKVCSRSGLALKNSVFVLNAPGIVDQDYRGDVGVILHNAGTESFAVAKGQKIAQLVFEEVFIPDVVEVVDIAEEHQTQRGAGGFGSTDKEAA